MPGLQESPFSCVKLENSVKLEYFLERSRGADCSERNVGNKYNLVLQKTFEAYRA